MKEENQTIMRLINEQLLKGSNPSPDGQNGENNRDDSRGGNDATPLPLTPRRPAREIVSPIGKTPRTEAELEQQFERWMEKRSIGGVIGACVAPSSTPLTP
ncbi:hypothetical protein M5689_012733 [Euphorbia peplus]|nr:hypothetical protein M5689_012733 [Euphorbia peplus]